MKIVEGVSDAGLLVEARTSVAAYEAFYRRYVRRVTAFAAARCTSAEDTADVVALTFVRLLDALDTYDPDRGEAGPFLFGIAANVARDLHRRNARQVAVQVRVAGRDLLGPDDIARVEEAIDAVQAAGEVRDAIDKMPAGEQDVMRIVATGRSPGQAADELGISPGAAWTRLSRARRRLHDQLPMIDEERSR